MRLGGAAPTAPDFLSRARRGLHAGPPSLTSPPAKGDHDLDGADLGIRAAPKPAAVLVPVVTHADAPSILLTQRASGLRDHSGQIAFPGGKVDATDASPLATALREAEEEIGLDRSFVEAIGYLDGYRTVTGYLVTPVVGLVTPGFSLMLNAHEVEDAFEVPLAFLMDAANHAVHARIWNGRPRRSYAMPFGERYIWGVTAGILRNLYERLYLP